MDNQKNLPVKNNLHQVTATHNVPDKRLDTRQTSEQPSSQLYKEAKAGVLKQQRSEADMNVNKQDRAKIKATDQVSKEPTNLATNVKVSKKEGGVMNGAMKGEERALMSSHRTAEVSKQQSLHGSTAEEKVKGGFQVEVIRPSMAHTPVGHLSPPIIKLEPLEVKDMKPSDGVQSMEVR